MSDCIVELYVQIIVSDPQRIIPVDITRLIWFYCGALIPNGRVSEGYRNWNYQYTWWTTWTSGLCEWLHGYDKTIYMGVIVGNKKKKQIQQNEIKGKIRNDHFIPVLCIKRRESREGRKMIWNG